MGPWHPHCIAYNFHFILEKKDQKLAVERKRSQLLKVLLLMPSYGRGSSMLQKRLNKVTGKAAINQQYLHVTHTVS